MELQEIRYFAKVAEVGHLTRAARALHLSQPALSRAIARLEADLGAPLFDRVGRQIRLNQVGRTFLAYAQRVLRDVDEGARAVADLVGPGHGLLTLGMTRTVSAEPLPELLGLFRAGHPGITFRIVQNSTPRVLEQMLAGAVDLCLLPLPVEQQGIVSLPLLSQPLLLAVPAGHRLAGVPAATLAEVATEEFVGLLPDTRLRKASDALCAQAGFTPRFAFEGEELALVFRLVASGLGVALMPAHAWQAFAGPAPVGVPLREPHGEWSVGLAWPEGRYLPAAPRLFRHFIAQHFDKEAPAGGPVATGDEAGG